MVPEPRLGMVLPSTCLCVCCRKRLLTHHTAGGKPGQAALIYTPFVFIAKSAKLPIRYNILPVPVSPLQQSGTRELPQILYSSWYQSWLFLVFIGSKLQFSKSGTKHFSQTKILSGSILEVNNWLNSALCHGKVDLSSHLEMVRTTFIALHTLVWPRGWCCCPFAKNN